MQHADDLHGVKNASVECLMERIVDYHIDPNIIKNGEAVIHNFAKQNKYDHILALLLYSRKPCIDINIANEHNGNTPLHIAIEVLYYSVNWCMHDRLLLYRGVILTLSNCY